MRFYPYIRLIMIFFLTFKCNKRPFRVKLRQKIILVNHIEIKTIQFSIAKFQVSPSSLMFLQKILYPTPRGKKDKRYRARPSHLFNSRSKLPSSDSRKIKDTHLYIDASVGYITLSFHAHSNLET